MKRIIHVPELEVFLGKRMIHIHNGDYDGIGLTLAEFQSIVDAWEKEKKDVSDLT
jgi:hypothetical protein